jgi:hypothetical protein
MRFVLAALTFTALLPLASSTPRQDPQPPPSPPNPLAGFAPMTKEALSNELLGSWMLVRFDSVTGIVDPADVRGFAMFEPGLCTILLHAHTISSGFIVDSSQYYVFGGAMRWRISDSLRLQTATILAHSNANEDDELEFEPASMPREYTMMLAGGTLTLVRGDGAQFVFRRMLAGEFPKEADEALRRGASVR